MTGIYKITSPSGRVYIGQSIDIANRKRYYKRLKCKPQPLIYASLVKYGFDNHKFEVIHELPKDVSRDILDNYEIIYWEQYKNLGFKMMNCKDAGKSGRLSENSKEKIRKSLTGRKHSEETIQKRVLSNAGKKCSERTKAIISKRFKGLPRSQESIMRQSITRKEKYIPSWNKGIKMTDEYKIHSLRNNKSIIQLTLDGKFIKRFNYIKEAAKEANTDRNGISLVCRNLQMTCNGFKWKYEEDYNKAELF